MVIPRMPHIQEIRPMEMHWRDLSFENFSSVVREFLQAEALRAKTHALAINFLTGSFGKWWDDPDDSDWWSMAGHELGFSRDKDVVRRYRATKSFERQCSHEKLWQWNTRLQTLGLPPSLEHEESLTLIGKSKAAAAYVQHNAHYKNFIDELLPRER